MKKFFLLLTLVSTLTFASCSGKSDQKNEEEDTTEAVSNSAQDLASIIPSEENYVEWTKKNCGIDLSFEKDVWLPAYFKRVPQGYKNSLYAKGAQDNTYEMIVNLVQQCLNASQTHTVGPDPQCSTVDEVVEKHFTKTYKSEANPSIGFTYLGDLIYEYKGANIVFSIKLTQGQKTSTLTYTIQKQAIKTE